METLFQKAKRLGLWLGFKKLIGYEVAFSWGYRERIKGRELYTEKGLDKPFTLVPNTARYWYADPLVCEYQGKQVVFLECMDRKTNLGSIATVALTGDSIYKKKPHQVIIEPFHMSFPMTFEWNGELYMLPETEMIEEICLYRCVEFPWKWRRAGRFLEGHKIVDSVVTEITEDAVYLLGSEYDPVDPKLTRFVRYRLVRENGNISAEWIDRDTEEYTYESRMAGPIVNGTICPVQRSTPAVYGFSTKFMEWKDGKIGELIREILPKQVHCKGTRNRLIGTHTYSATEDFEIIDIEYLVRKKKFKKKRYWK